MIISKYTERIRDVGLTLLACSKYNQKLGRLQLQKFIYLTDSLALCVKLYSVKDGHETYLNGPYDGKIQNAADILLFWGILNASNIVITERSISCDYSITTEGINWVEKLIISNENIKKRWELIVAIANALMRRNAFSRLKDYVYSEPTYSQLSAKGYNYSLDLGLFEKNLTAQIIALMERSFAMDKIKLNAPFIADFLLEYLERRKLITGVGKEDE